MRYDGEGGGVDVFEVWVMEVMMVEWSRMRRMIYVSVSTLYDSFQLPSSRGPRGRPQGT